MKVAVETDPRGFDLLKSYYILQSGTTAINLVEEPLFDRDEQDNLLPCLALSVESSDDGLTWTVKLREGVTFHDGSPFNADAVVHHWAQIINLEHNGRYTRLLRPIKAVEKVDDHTVRFRLSQPWLRFLDVLSRRNEFAAFIPSPKAVDAGTQNDAPVGTGPFMFKEWKRGETLTLTRNPNYWRKGKPYLDTIIFRTLPDHETRFASLQSGDFQVILTDRGIHLNEARQSDSLKLIQRHEDGAETSIMNARRPPFDNPLVRQALAHAQDQRNQNRMVYADESLFVEHPFGPDLKCEDTHYRDYNPERARELLAEYGKPVSFVYMHTNTNRGRTTCAIYQRSYKEVGVEMQCRPLTGGEIVRLVIAKDFDMSPWAIPPAANPEGLLHLIQHTQGAGNRGGAGDPELDQLLDELTNTMDTERLNALRCRIAQKINDEAYLIYRGARCYSAIAGPSVEGITGITNGAPLLMDAWIKH